jgi:hypothetical protein
MSKKVSPERSNMLRLLCGALGAFDYLRHDTVKWRDYENMELIVSLKQYYDASSWF